jgi:hypothetical protein
MGQSADLNPESWNLASPAAGVSVSVPFVPSPFTLDGGLVVAAVLPVALFGSGSVWIRTA